MVCAATLSKLGFTLNVWPDNAPAAVGDHAVPSRAWSCPDRLVRTVGPTRSRPPSCSPPAAQHRAVGARPVDVERAAQRGADMHVAGASVGVGVPPPVTPVPETVIDSPVPARRDGEPTAGDVGVVELGKLLPLPKSALL